MSHGKLRIDKNCLNCESHVEEKYCPNCGQENVETKQAFHYLFTHFIEDFTHYDGQFWETIKYLLFSPGKLTKEYLAGKRQQFVAPVKLYIFVSFVTFFLFSIFSPLPSFSAKDSTQIKKEAQKSIKNQLQGNNMKGKPLSKEDSLALVKVDQILKDSTKINKSIEAVTSLNSKLDDSFQIYGFKTKEEFDRHIELHPSWKNSIKKPFAYKFFELKEMGISKKEILIKLFETAFHNLPKALFIYLPLFAFFLWIFHNKKKWWYFDHGIFTLHYFSFLLLIITFSWILGKIGTNSFLNFIQGLINFVLIIYMLVYFFLAHHRVYHSGKRFSVLIGMILFMINFFAFSFLLAGLMVLSLLMVK